jgi:hypothetical protein
MRSHDRSQATRAGFLPDPPNSPTGPCGQHDNTGCTCICLVHSDVLANVLTTVLAPARGAEQDSSARRHRPAPRRSAAKPSTAAGQRHHRRGVVIWDPQRPHGRPHRHRHATASGRTQTQRGPQPRPRPETGTTPSLRATHHLHRGGPAPGPGPGHATGADLAGEGALCGPPRPRPASAPGRRAQWPSYTVVGQSLTVFAFADLAGKTGRNP